MSLVVKSFVTSVNRRALGYVPKSGILLNTDCCFKCFNSIVCVFLQAKDNLRRELVMYDSLGKEPQRIEKFKKNWR